MVFFRRLAEGVFDMEDLRRRTHELADFVEVYTELLFNQRKTYFDNSGQVWQFGFGQTTGGLFGTGPNSSDSSLSDGIRLPAA